MTRMSKDVDIKREEEEEDVKVKVEADTDTPEYFIEEGVDRNKTGKWDVKGAISKSKTSGCKTRRRPPTSAKEKAAAARRGRERRANETPEERKARLERHKRDYRRRMGRETSEERQARRDMENKRQKLRRGTGSQSLEEALVADDDDEADQQLREEVKQILIEKRDKWKHRAVTWEEDLNGRLLMSRAKMLRVRNAYRQFIAKRKRLENMSEEELAREKQQKTLNNIMKWAHMPEERKKKYRIENYFRAHAKKASLSVEEREEIRQKQREKNMRYFSNMKEEQKKRHKENVRKAVRRYQQRNKEMLQRRYKEKIREYQRSLKERQTPEQRQKTLLTYRINQAKRLLKRKLEKGGVTPEEIQKQVDQLDKKMRSEPLPPLDQVSEYKPRPSKRQRQEYLEVGSSKILTINSAEQPPPSSSVSGSGLLIRQSSDILEGEAVVERELKEDAGDFYDNSSMTSPTTPTSPLPCQLDPEFSTTSDAHDLIEFEQHHFASSSMCTEEQQDTDTIEPHSSKVTPSSPSPTVHLPGLGPTSESLPPSTVPMTTSENKCYHCSDSFIQIMELHSHIRSTHPEKCWKCPKCLTLALSPQEFSEHYKSHQSTSVVAVLKKREDITESPRNFNRNRRPGKRKSTTHEPIKSFPFSCMKCPVRSRPRSSKTSQFKTHDKLTEHVRVSHPRDFFPCPQCNLLKYNSASLKIHSKICRKKLKS